MSLVKGCCPLDCQDTCSWVAEVEDGRVIRVTGAKEHPYTRGALCAKVNDYPERTYSSDRLLYPLRRNGPKGGGRFERVSWENALDEIARRFQEIVTRWGPEAILPHRYLGSMGAIQANALSRMFNVLGATRQVGNICGAALSAGLAEMGSDVPQDPEGIAHARFILLWGANPLSTNHHIWHFIQQARRVNGARVIAIDPRPTRSTAQADSHLPIRVNSDIYLALALGHVILAEGLEDRDFLAEHSTGLEAYRTSVAQWTPERAEAHTGIAAETTRELARAFAAARPASIKLGVNLAANSAGAEMAEAIAALSVLCGHWRLPGGGLHAESHPGHNSAKAAGVHLAHPGVRTLSIGRFGETLTDPRLDPPVKAVMIWGTNPVLVQPDAGLVRQGLLREDLFTVVLEHFMTDTARLADIVLPSTTQLEHFDVHGSWGHHYMSVNLPAVPPVGESRDHGWVARELASRLGLPDLIIDELIHDFLPAGVSLDDLKEKGWIKVDRPRVMPRAKLDFPVKLPAQPTAEHPLVLISPKSHYSLNSSFMNQPRHRQNEGEPTAELSAGDAAARGLVDGALARIFNAQGELSARVSIRAQMQPGVVCLPGRRWQDQMNGGDTVNVLTPARTTEKGGQPTYNECFVEVAAAGSK